MAVGDRLQIADKPTLDLTKADTTEILERIGDTGGGTGDSVVEMLQTLLNTPKIIRHIQRGTYSGRSFNGAVLTIELTGFTNVDKIIVLIDGLLMGEQAERWVIPYISGLTISQLSLSADEKPDRYHSGSYQVIEFA